MAQDMGVPFLGRLPLDPALMKVLTKLRRASVLSCVLAQACEEGQSFCEAAGEGNRVVAILMCDLTIILMEGNSTVVTLNGIVDRILAEVDAAGTAMDENDES